MTKIKPLVLLDIDGVLNPLGKIEEEYVVHSNDWQNFRIPFSVIDWLISIQDKVTFVCSSSWEEDAAGLFRHIFVNISETISFSENYPYGWSKTLALENFFAKNSTPIIVLDDEFPKDFAENNKHRTHVHCYSVNGLTGLTSEDFARLNKIIEKLSCEK